MSQFIEDLVLPYVLEDSAGWLSGCGGGYIAGKGIHGVV
jgi:hypothetical protein